MDFDKLLKFKGNILVTGETGSGKSYWCEQFALRREGTRARIVTVDLASLTENLLESELFGHKRGAFTGAISGHIGFFEKVGEGTIILDEIGELDLNAQKKLLTLLERRVFRRVGSNSEIKFKGKVLAATNRNLSQMVQDGAFREDLYYRLNVFHHYITPFRDLAIAQKKEIIKSLILRIMQIYQLQEAPLFSIAVKERMLSAAWPGNIRQVLHLLEFLLVMHEGKMITLKDINQALQNQNGDVRTRRNNIDFGDISFRQAKAQFEKAYIEHALLMAQGYINRAAMLSGISKSTLLSKIRQFEINVLKYKDMEKSMSWVA